MAEISQDNKRMAKNTVYLYLRMLISLAISLYTSRAILDALGVQDYGIYEVVGGFVTMFSVLIGSIRSAAQRFITFSLGKGDLDNQRKTFSTFSSLFLILSAILFVVIEIVGLLCLDTALNIPADRMDMAYFVFHCSVITFIITLIAVPYNASVIAHEKMDFFAIVSLGESFSKLLLVYILYKTGYDRLMVYAIFLCLVSVVVRLIYSGYCHRHFVETKGKLSIDKPILKKILSYSVWMIIGTSSAVFKEQGVNLVINRFFGVAMNTARGVGNQISSVVGMFSGSIGQAINPQITKSYAAGEVQRSIKLTFFSTKVQGLMMLVICVPLFIEMDYVLALWLKEVPYYASVFARWALILTVCRNLENSIVPLMLAVGKVKYPQLVAATTMILNLPLSWLALKWGAEASSTMVIGCVIEIVVLALVALFLRSYIKFPVRSYFFTSVIPVMIVGVIAALLPEWIKYQLPADSFLSFFLVCGIAFIITCLLSFFIALNKEEKTLVINMAKKILKR